MKRGRKPSVKVNGEYMTGEKYQNAILSAVKGMGNTWVTADTIISWAHNNGLCEKKNAKRKGHSHPIYKILSNMTYNSYTSVLDWRVNKKGLFEYKFK